MSEITKFSSVQACSIFSKNVYSIYTKQYTANCKHMHAILLIYFVGLVFLVFCKVKYLHVGENTKYKASYMDLPYNIQG